MTEESRTDLPEQEPPAPARTGNADVDAVLDSLEGLDAKPIGEHVPVFEQAHDRLRAALTSAGDDRRS